MAKQATIDKRKAVLRARGVPEKFVDAIARRRKASDWLLTLLLVYGAVIVGSFCFSNHLKLIVAPWLWSGARDSLLFAGPSRGTIAGIVFYLGAAAMITAMAVYICIIFPGRKTKPSPAPHHGADTLRNLSAGQSLNSIHPNPTFAALADLPDDVAFLDAVTPPARMKLIAFIIMQVVLLTMVTGILFGIHQTAVGRAVTLDAVHLQTPTSETVYPLAEADYATPICDSATRGGFNYVLHFDDPRHLKYQETDISLWQPADVVHSLNGDQVLQRLEQIDARLEQLNIPVRRVAATGSVHDDSLACIDETVQGWHLRDGRALRRLMFGEGRG